MVEKDHSKGLGAFCVIHLVMLTKVELHTCKMDNSVLFENLGQISRSIGTADAGAVTWNSQRSSRLIVSGGTRNTELDCVPHAFTNPHDVVPVLRQYENGQR